MNRRDSWKAQGSYRSFNTGKPMILVNNGGATVLEPLTPEVRKCKRCGDPLDLNDDIICGYHHLEN